MHAPSEFMFRRLATIEAPAATRGSIGGTPRTSWSVTHADLRVMVQPHASRPILLAGGETAETDVTIFTLSTLTGVARGHRITVDGAQVYLVLVARPEGDNLQLTRIEGRSIQ